MHRTSRLLLSWIETWQFAVAGVSALFVASIVVSTAQDLSGVSIAKAQVEADVARVIADDHAHRVVERLGEFAGVASATDRIEVAGYASTVTIRTVEDRSMLEISVATPSLQTLRYACDVLQGSSPRGLRHGIVVGGRAGRLGDDESALEFESSVTFDSAMASAVRFDQASAREEEQREAISRGSFLRDDSVALMRLKSGTDQPDFTLAVDQDGIARPWFGNDGILVLDGNLWIPSGAEPLVIEIARTATLVVRGNCYFDRSLSVVSRDPSATAALVIVIEPQPGVAWSEGSGCAYFGLPRPENARVSGDAAPLSIDASVVARGDVVLHRSVVHDAALVVVGHLHLGADVEFLTRGSRRLGARDGVPGLVPEGPPRPGQIRDCSADL